MRSCSYKLNSSSFIIIVIIIIVISANGACTCFEGFLGTTCGQCDSDILCNGRGQCLTNSSTVTTVQEGEINPVECICHEYWDGPQCGNCEYSIIPFVYPFIRLVSFLPSFLFVCLFFVCFLFAVEIPDKSLVRAIGIMNGITQIGWLIMFALVILSILIEEWPSGKLLNQFVSMDGVHVSCHSSFEFNL